MSIYDHDENTQTLTMSKIKEDYDHPGGSSSCLLLLLGLLGLLVRRGGGGGAAFLLLTGDPGRLPPCFFLQYIFQAIKFHVLRYETQTGFHPVQLSCLKTGTMT